ncbi:MAG: single-stranded DNA-binding protein [Sphingomonadales bacterium]|nr:single-stranded DNA-binding protein [Sphingomonadales bacterium]
MINKVILLGRLGKDPVVRRLDNGRVVANVTLATNDYYTKDGQRMESTEWHNLEMWDKQAETAEKYLKKGSLLYVEGKIRTDRYTDAEGQERQTRKIRVNNFQMMGSMLAPRSEEGQRSDSHSDSNSTDAGHAMDMDHDDEGLPF